MSTSLLKFSFKTGLVKSLLFEIISKVSSYHYTFGRKGMWPTIVDPTDSTKTISSETNAPEISDSFPDELTTRENIVYIKGIDSNDACAIIERRNWVTGVVYDMYDDYSTDYPADSGATSPDTSTFYVINDEYNVYKCLYNYEGSTSTVRPNGTSREPVTYEDGYIWKYMYTIPLYMRNKFMSSRIMPVVTALTSQFYSNGSIIGYSLQNKGNDLVKTNTYGLTKVHIINAGTGYTADDFYIDPPNKLATFVSTVDGNGALTITLTQGGNGYSEVNPPQIYISAPESGVQAVATTTVVNGVVDTIVMDEQGSGYVLTGDYAAVITIDNPIGVLSEGDPATPTFEVAVGDNGEVEIINIIDPGAGYGNNELPQLKIKDTSIGTGFSGKEVYELDTYTIINVNGDGYNPKNPYSLKSIDVIDGGTFASIVSGNLIVWPTPQLDNGGYPSVKINWAFNATPITGYPSGYYYISSVDVVEQGGGYTYPVIWEDDNAVNQAYSPILTAAGVDLDFNTSTQKNEAIFTPIINSTGELDAIYLENAGLGYTYISATVESKITTYGTGGRVTRDTSVVRSSTFDSPLIQLDFGIGDIEGKQADVELNAIDGAIYACRIQHQGNGTYTEESTSLVVVGDGTGCQMKPVIQNGNIVSVIVTNPGKNYREATVHVYVEGLNTWQDLTDSNVTQDFSVAIIKPIIAPKGGHGKDAINELYANTIMFTSRIINERLYNEVLLQSGYRQISIIKNILAYGATALYKNATGTTCVLLKGEINSQNTTTFSKIQLTDINGDQQDQYMYLDDNTKYLVIEAEEINGIYNILLQPVKTTNMPTSGNSVYINVDDTAYYFSISSVVSPTINKYSGDMIYQENKIKFAATEEQAVVVSTLIKF